MVISGARMVLAGAGDEGAIQLEGWRVGRTVSVIAGSISGGALPLAYSIPGLL